jgi:hypothetical protein
MEQRNEIVNLGDTWKTVKLKKAEVPIATSQSMRMHLQSNISLKQTAKAAA